MLTRFLRVLRVPSRVWWGSLPLRVVSTTLAGTVIVLLLGGWLLMQQASSGIQNGKRSSALAEASTAVESMEQALRDASSGQSGSGDALTRVAFAAVQRGAVGGQYHVVVQGPVSDILTPGLDTSCIPERLRAQVAAAGETEGQSLFVSPAEVRYTDGRPSVPGLVVGARVGASSSARYPAYFVFPMTQEAGTLRILQSALLTTGLVAMAALALIAYWVARQVMGPVRTARLSAERLASGELTERMRVRGTDDLASLAVSMNFMASELAHRIRQLEELSLVQQRFVSDVSHELRTPLTTVRLAADLIYDGRDQLAPVEERSAELMRKELDRFEALLADLLEISRFDAGAAELTADEIDVGRLVGTEVEALRPFAATKGSTVEVRSPADATAEVDSRRLGRVLRNLLTNAIEHGESRPVEVAVAVNETALAITVRDHGVGFEPADAQNVFHRFWRADPARARRVGGTGLGLAISMEDVRLHGGYLDAWGEPGGGAQFRVTLPRRQGVPMSRSPLPVAPSPRTEGWARPDRSLEVSR